MPALLYDTGALVAAASLGATLALHALWSENRR